MGIRSYGNSSFYYKGVVSKMKNSINYSLAKGNTKMSCRNIYPAWLTVKEFMRLTAAIRFFFICLMMAADTEGRLIKDCFYFLQRICFRDFHTEEEVDDALCQMESNGLIIIYPYESEGYKVELIQIVDFHKFQAGKSYIYGSSVFPPPEGYVVEPPSNQTVEKDERFESFYNTYKKKYKKKEAAAAWSEIAPDDATYLTIMEGLSRWIPYFSTLKKNEIPNPSVFLKSKMFLSVPPICASASSVSDTKNSDQSVTKNENTSFANQEGYSTDLPF